ncbi:MAG: glutamyl-tRNA amidotransferase [Legionellales bacterium]|nr:glutamyl-tRNA amidotransferase [Legionellales bacterium]
MTQYDFQSSNAFVSTFTIHPYQTGLLDNLTFAVKDNIDIAGHKTSYGSKSWLATHPPAVCHALCIEQLLSSGATCLGKTISDEFTYSLDGESYFYGTPINPKAPDRIPGGSSSGPASAVACDLVDFAIGTDCAGSIRVPASLCGIWGMRPTTHRISEAGVLPFVPSISTVGVLAKQLSTLEKVMHVLLRSQPSTVTPIKNIYLLEDAFDIAHPVIRKALNESISRLKNMQNITVKTISFSDVIQEKISLFECNEEILRIIQSAEVWNSVGAWLEAFMPEMGSRARAGLDNVKQTDRSKVNDALIKCERIFTKIEQFTQEGDLFCFPTVPVLTPVKGQLDQFENAMEFYRPTMAVTSFSGAGRLPEISIPIAKIGTVPVGLSLVAGHRKDEFLLAVAKQLFGSEPY